MSRSHAEQRRTTRVKRRLIHDYETGKISGSMLSMVVLLLRLEHA